jgi:hypothetical protein
MSPHIWACIAVSCVAFGFSVAAFSIALVALNAH